MLKTLGPGAIGIRGWDLPEAIALAAETGFNAVTFDIREAAKLSDERGVSAVRDLFDRASVRPAVWGAPVAYGQDDRRREDLERLPRLAAVAVELGCSTAATGVGPGSNDRPFAENFAWHVERLRPVAESLRTEGCRLAIEFIGPKTFRAPFRHEFIYSLAGLKELIAAIGTGNVGVTLDAWHLYTSGGEVAEIDALGQDDVLVVHVNDAPAGVEVDAQVDNVRELPLATGVIDLAGFMGALRRIGFAGPVMAEPFNSRLEALAADDPRAAARETKRALDAVWRVAGMT